VKVERIPYESNAKKHPHTGHREDIEERHESFGLVNVSRLFYGSGTNNMFGSHLDNHPTTFRFSVKRAIRQHTDLAYDRYHADSDAECPEVVEFEMTATQFIDALTSLNMGEGVPCTLRRVMGTAMEPVPVEHKSERQLIRERFEKEMQDIAKSVQPLTSSIDEILAKKTIGKCDREEIASLVKRIIMTLDDHAPFAMKQFNESTTRMEVAGKAEVEAYADSVIRAAGLEALQAIKEARDPDFSSIADMPSQSMDAPPGATGIRMIDGDVVWIDADGEEISHHTAEDDP